MNQWKPLITEAFKDVAYPGDDLIKTFGSDASDWNDTWLLFKGCSWQEMPVAEFLQCDTPLPDLSQDGFHYYLPALLIASLDDSFELNLDVASMITFHLSPKANMDPALQCEIDRLTARPFLSRVWQSLFSRDTDHVIQVLGACHHYTVVFCSRIMSLSPQQRKVVAQVLQEFADRQWEELNDVEETISILYAGLSYPGCVNDNDSN
ncbi:DUF6714 family protein [Polystyrenella longa]|nr:DUF6714 family protein [Polystyrenella longa]